MSGVEVQFQQCQQSTEHAVVEDGGLDESNSANVAVSVGARLAMDHTVIRNATGDGPLTDQRSVLAKFEANTFENNGRAMSIKVSDMAMIDPATTFTANKKNYVYVHSAGLRTLQNARLTQSGNRLHDNKQAISAEQ